MIEFTVDTGESGQTLQDIFVSRYPSVPFGRLLKALRARDVKVNGQRVSDAKMRLSEGFIVKLYIDAAQDPAARGGDPGADDVRTAETGSGAARYTVFENSYIIVAEKPQGILSEPDANRPGEAAFSELFRETGAELCHRLDRNTGGLLILSKKPELTEGIKQAINARRYRKVYLAKVVGDARKVIGSCAGGNGTGAGRKGTGANEKNTANAKGWHSFKAWHRKNAGDSIVTVSDRKLRGSKEIETLVRYIGSSELGDVQVSDVEVMLVTGRTHQIRAHLAHLNIPVAGDGKYGSEAVRRRTGLKFQALWAWKLEPGSNYEGPKEIGGIPVDEILPEQTFCSKPEFR